MLLLRRVHRLSGPTMLPIAQSTSAGCAVRRLRFLTGSSPGWRARRSQSAGVSPVGCFIAQTCATAATCLCPIHSVSGSLSRPSPSGYRSSLPSSEPHRWLGGYEHLKRAIELDPSDEIARRRFIGCVLGRVDYATHELPHGYLGEPIADLAVPAEAEVALCGLSSEDDHSRAAAEIAEQRRLIEDYLHRR